MSVSYIAYATGTDSKVGADAGISVERHVMEDGILRETAEVARETAEGTEIDGDDDGLDLDAAEKLLGRMGYQLAGSWFLSGGQWGVEVETATTFPVGSVVVYEGELPCDDAAHTGSVTAVKNDASGDQVVTVEFDCGLVQDIPASELQSAE